MNMFRSKEANPLQLDCTPKRSISMTVLACRHLLAVEPRVWKD
jgi:hypothetical protein